MIFCQEQEFELLDTGVFDDDRYFDVFVEYAKDGPEDILVKITAVNRGPDAAELHLLPTLWFRNDWASWIARPAANRWAGCCPAPRKAGPSWPPWAAPACPPATAGPMLSATPPIDDAALWTTSPCRRARRSCGTAGSK